MTTTERTYENDKKLNMQYWDIIDELLGRTIEKLTAFSSTEVELDDDSLVAITSDVREVVIKKLEENGATFPFIKENY